MPSTRPAAGSIALSPARGFTLLELLLVTLILSWGAGVLISDPLPRAGGAPATTSSEPLDAVRRFIEQTRHLARARGAPVGLTWDLANHRLSRVDVDGTPPWLPDALPSRDDSVLELSALRALKVSVANGAADGAAALYFDRHGRPLALNPDRSELDGLWRVATFSLGNSRRTLSVLPVTGELSITD